MKSGRVLIITGMHRSGTSLVAGLLQQAGLDIGQNLLPANRGNPYGYLEDTDFLNFQEELLRARGLDMFVTQPVDFVPTTSEIEQAKALIAARASKPLWGWKDPRTSLFLDFWAQLLPEARYIFLYRHPLEVIASLMRRGDFSQNGRIELGLQSWCVYNQAIVRFVQKQPAKCILCQAYRAADNIDVFQSLLNQKFGVDLSPDQPHLQERYHPTLLHRLTITEETNTVLSQIHPPTVELLTLLNQLADLPVPLAKNENDLTPDLSGIYRRLETYSNPPSSLQMQSKLLLLIAALQPEIFEQFWLEISQNLQAATAECGRLWETVKTRDHHIQQFKTILHSQDMLTRQFATLTLNNLLDIWRDPVTVKRKVNRWTQHRLNRKGQNFGAEPSAAPADYFPAVITNTVNFTFDELQWVEQVQSTAPKAIAVAHPEWRGVRSATVNLFPVVKFVEDTLNKERANRLALLLAETGCKRFVFCGFPLSYQHLVPAINSLIPTAQVYVFWLGNFLQSSEDYNWDAFGLIKQMCEAGQIYKWGFAKKGMAEVMTKIGLRTGFVMSMVNPIPTGPSVPMAGGPHFGIWSMGSSWRKLPYAMLAAATLIPGAVVHGSGAGQRVQEFATAMQLRSNLQAEVIPQEQMPIVLSQMHLNLYITLSECAPMLPLESLSIGVPCLLGPNSHLFEDHPFLHKSLVVPYPDSSASIAGYARRALENRVEIINQYIDYAPEYNSRAKASLAEFLEVD